MRRFIILAIIGLAGCAQTATVSPQAIAAGAPQAFYPTFPEALFIAASEVCTAPGEVVIRPNRSNMRCEALPTPPVAAGLILEFDGTVESLPRFVYAVIAQQQANGFLVTLDTYIDVPQDGGGVRKVRFAEMGNQIEARDILTMTGGTLLPAN